jgi:hypothetical protein
VSQDWQPDWSLLLPDYTVMCLDLISEKDRWPALFKFGVAAEISNVSNPAVSRHVSLVVGRTEHPLGIKLANSIDDRETTS